MFDTTRQYEVALIINGQPLTEYSHGGNTFVEGRTNSTYDLRIKNNSYERILAIPSVDGLSVIDGKAAGADSPGYVLDPHQSLDIPGWKVDGETAAKFQFGSSTGSYSNRTGRGKQNVGVIGLMVFRPKPVIINNSYTFMATSADYNPLMWTTMGGGLTGTPTGDFTTTVMGGPGSPKGLRSMTGGSIQIDTTIPLMNASMNNMAASPTPVQSLGTEYGDATKFQTTTTTFEKRDAAYPDALLSIFYDDARGLEARGIILNYRNTTPQAFPTYTNSSSYAPPPPGWTKK